MTFKEQIFLLVVAWRSWQRYATTFFLLALFVGGWFYFVPCHVARLDTAILLNMKDLPDRRSLGEGWFDGCSGEVFSCNDHAYIQQSHAFFSALTPSDTVAQLLALAQDHHLNVMTCTTSRTLEKNDYCKTRCTLALCGNFFSFIDFLNALECMPHALCRSCSIERIDDATISTTCHFSLYTTL